MVIEILCHFIKKRFAALTASFHTVSSVKCQKGDKRLYVGSCLFAAIAVDTKQ